jgi:uncharacterized UBP type Zn finger protein
MPYYEQHNLDFNTLINNNICPYCGAKLINEGGCKICHNCFWSACL